VTRLAHVLIAGVAMSAIALSGSLALVLPPRQVERLITPLVAFAAGALLGGGLLHLLPAASAAGLPARAIGAWTLAGFLLFLLLEQVIHRHRHHRGTSGAPPVSYLVLVGDGLHNLLGGLAIGAAFVSDVRLGWTAWLAAAAHEVPQELGDFGVLIRGGWSSRRVLVLNLLSGATFLVGALLACLAPGIGSVAWLIPFAAGNFLYIAAVDLIPELARPVGAPLPATALVAFAAGIGLMLATPAA